MNKAVILIALVLNLLFFGCSNSSDVSSNDRSSSDNLVSYSVELGEINKRDRANKLDRNRKVMQLYNGGSDREITFRDRATIQLRGLDNETLRIETDNGEVTGKLVITSNDGVRCVVGNGVAIRSDSSIDVTDCDIQPNLLYDVDVHSQHKTFSFSIRTGNF